MLMLVGSSAGDDIIIIVVVATTAAAVDDFGAPAAGVVIERIEASGERFEQGLDDWLLLLLPSWIR